MAAGVRRTTTICCLVFLARISCLDPEVVRQKSLSLDIVFGPKIILHLVVSQSFKTLLQIRSEFMNYSEGFKFENILNFNIFSRL